jgi:hypothetical protein
MLVFDGVGALLLLLVVPLLGLAIRRHLIRRGRGTVEVSLRLKPSSHGRGWALGMARYEDDELQWFRTFSFALRPRRTLTRRGLTVDRRRIPSGPEALALQAGAVVLECQATSGPVQLAMSESALTGFLSWLESAPPGATLPPYQRT